MSDENVQNVENVHTLSDLKLKRDTFITIMSQRKTGKSYLLAELIYYFLTDPEEKVDFMYMFSETAGVNLHTNHQYSFIDKKAIIHPDNMNVVIPRLIQSQIHTDLKFKILVVFDDINMGKRQALIDKLAAMGRHFGITVIFSAQSCTNAVSPTVRQNSSYVLWRRLGEDKLKNYILPIVGSHPLFRKTDIFDYTEARINNFQFIFYNNDQDIDENTLKIVKARDVPKDYQYKVNVPSKPKPQRRPYANPYW